MAWIKLAIATANIYHDDVINIFCHDAPPEPLNEKGIGIPVVIFPPPHQMPATSATIIPPWLIWSAIKKHAPNPPPMALLIMLAIKVGFNLFAAKGIAPSDIPINPNTKAEIPRLRSSSVKNFLPKTTEASPQPNGAIGIAVATAPIISGSVGINVLAVTKAILLIGPPISNPIMAPNKKPIAILAGGCVPHQANPAATQSIPQPRIPLNPNKNGNTNIDVTQTGITIIGMIGLMFLWVGMRLNKLVKYPAPKPIIMAATIPRETCLTTISLIVALPIQSAYDKYNDGVAAAKVAMKPGASPARPAIETAIYPPITAVNSVKPKLATCCALHNVEPSGAPSFPYIPIPIAFIIDKTIPLNTIKGIMYDTPFKKCFIK